MTDAEYLLFGKLREAADELNVRLESGQYAREVCQSWNGAPSEEGIKHLRSALQRLSGRILKLSEELQ